MCTRRVNPTAIGSQREDGLDNSNRIRCRGRGVGVPVDELIRGSSNLVAEVVTAAGRGG